MPAEPRYIWASPGERNKPPERIEVITCPVCWALVEMPVLEAHMCWHRYLRGQVG